MTPLGTCPSSTVIGKRTAFKGILRRSSDIAKRRIRRTAHSRSAASSIYQIVKQQRTILEYNAALSYQEFFCALIVLNSCRMPTFRRSDSRPTASPVGMAKFGSAERSGDYDTTAPSVGMMKCGSAERSGDYHTHCGWRRNLSTTIAVELKRVGFAIGGLYAAGYFALPIAHSVRSNRHPSTRYAS